MRIASCFLVVHQFAANPAATVINDSYHYLVSLCWSVCEQEKLDLPDSPSSSKFISVAKTENARLRCTIFLLQLPSWVEFCRNGVRELSVALGLSKDHRHNWRLIAWERWATEGLEQEYIQDEEGLFEWLTGAIHRFWANWFRWKTKKNVASVGRMFLYWQVGSVPVLPRGIITCGCGDSCMAGTWLRAILFQTKNFADNGRKP